MEMSSSKDASMSKKVSSVSSRMPVELIEAPLPMPYQPALKAAPRNEESLPVPGNAAVVSSNALKPHQVMPSSESTP